MKPIDLLTSLFFLGLLSLVACRSEASSAHSDESTGSSPPVRFELQSFQRVSPSCASDSNRCARMQASYPLAVEGPGEVVRNINDTILYHLKTTLAVFAIDPEEINVSLDSLGDSYIREYETLMADSPDYPSPWDVETAGKVLHQNNKVVSVQLDNYSYTGGAHPNSFVILLNFDCLSGKKLDLADLVTDNEKFMKVAEEKFRQVRELPPGSDFDEAGFFWGDAFTFPANFAVTAEGIYFYYNPYEIAAYALGPTDFTITYEELGDLINRKQIIE